jgi:5-methylthioadenosine/S-adenosylhomocysteine deaminase
VSEQRLLIAGGDVLGPSGLARADVLVANGVIAQVGEIEEPPSGTPVLDAAGTIVMPGLVNAHMHSGENFNPGLYENLPLDLWFVRSHQVTRMEPMSADAIYTRTLLGAVQMLRSGTTTAVDFLYEAPEITLDTLEPVVRAYRDVGLRATVLLGVADLHFADSLPLGAAGGVARLEAAPPSLEAVMELGEAAADRFHQPGGLIGIGFGPSAPQRCSPELLEGTLELARRRGLAWQTHVLETKTQAMTALEWHGKSFIELMHERELLGPDSTLVHTVWLTDRDIELMRAAGSTAVHCLFSNMRLGDGIARLPALRRAGVRVALGTDGRGCVETLDMLELTRATALTHKARGDHYADWPNAADALTMATRGASHCAGHGENLGRIEAGAHADMVLLRRDTPTFTPLHDPVRQVVFGATSSDVRTVIVGGRVVVDNGQVVGIDVPALLRRAAEYAAEELAPPGGDPAPVEDAVRKVYERAQDASVGVHAFIEH